MCRYSRTFDPWQKQVDLSSFLDGFGKEWARNKKSDFLFLFSSGTENQTMTFLKAISCIVVHIQSSPSIS